LLHEIENLPVVPTCVGVNRTCPNIFEIGACGPHVCGGEPSKDSPTLGIVLIE